MSLDDGVVGLIGSIYAAVDDRQAWSAVLDDIKDRTGSHLLLMSAVDFGATSYHDVEWRGIDKARLLDGVREYDEAVFASDPMLAFGIANPRAGHVRLRNEIARRQGDPDTDHYARWGRDRLDIADSFVRYTPPANGLTLGMSIHAPTATGCHSPDAIALFLMLFEHVERAMRIALRPPDFIDEQHVAVMVTRDGRIVAASPAAAALFREHDGLVTDRGRLVAASPAHSRRLDAAIASALGALTRGSAGGAVALPRPSGRPDLLVRVDPMPDASLPFEAFRPAALVTVIEPDVVGVGPAAAGRWAALFGLTPAEIRLTAALLDDDASLRIVAERLGVAYATARFQLRSIFDKVGVRSQAQLARLLTRLGG